MTTTVSWGNRPRSWRSTAQIAIVVAVDHVAVGVDGDEPVGVTVEREPDVGTSVGDDPLERLEVVRAAVGVDVGAVRIGVDHRDVGTEGSQHLRPDDRSGAVRAVEDDAEAVSRRPSIDVAWR